MATKTFDYFVPVNPQPWRRARTSGKAHFTDKKSRAYKNAIGNAVKKIRRGGPPTKQAVKLDLLFCFPIPKSWPKYKRENPPRHTSVPDRDNLEKGIMDALNQIVWVDDAQIDSGDTVKKYSDHPGIHILITFEE